MSVVSPHRWIHREQEGSPKQKMSSTSFFPILIARTSRDCTPKTRKQAGDRGGRGFIHGRPHDLDRVSEWEVGEPSTIFDK